MCMRVFMYLCVCVCICKRERGKGIKRERERMIANLCQNIHSYFDILINNKLNFASNQNLQITK